MENVSGMLGAEKHPPAMQAHISLPLKSLTCRECDGAELHPVEVAPDPPVLHHGVPHGLVVLDVPCKEKAGG